MNMVHEFTPLLIASKRNPAVVMIGSIDAVIPLVFASAYNATKAALHAYANTLRVELAPFG
jgi:1-acylglycerone phosphate reductase